MSSTPELMLEWFNIHRIINAIYHISQRKDRNHTAVSVDIEKAFDKTQHAFTIKTLKNRHRRYIS